MRFMPNNAIGRPSFDLNDDEISLVIDLLCQGAAEARPFVNKNMLEVPLTILVRKAMLRVKRKLSLSNIEVRGEQEILDIYSNDPSVQGRIDITLKFMHQFSDEDAYVGVECKRLADGNKSLNKLYVSEGVARFATGKYGSGHTVGMMLGYVQKLPSDKIVKEIDSQVQTAYGTQAKFAPAVPHSKALEIHTNSVPQGTGGHQIELTHIYVDMAIPLPTAALSPSGSVSV